jgi:hypothetical protein
MHNYESKLVIAVTEKPSRAAGPLENLFDALLWLHDNNPPQTNHETIICMCTACIILYMCMWLYIDVDKALLS